MFQTNGHDDILPFLDVTTTSVDVRVVDSGGRHFLRVSQHGDDPGTLLLERTPTGLVVRGADNVITDGARLSAPLPRGVCGLSPDADYPLLATYSAAHVGMSTAAGPDGGNLACAWAVRQIVHGALGRWIGHEDGTAEMGAQLARCFPAVADPDLLPAGAIVISPTRQIAGSARRNIGHVGLLGSGQGDQRLIYSNSSASAQWAQNYTVGRWRSRYADLKGLDVLFFHLPIYS